MISLMKKRYFLFVLLGLFCLFFLDFLGLFRIFDDRIYDLSFRIRGARNPGSEVIIVGIDEETLSRYGRWPLKRSLYAGLLQKVDGAAVVGFDIVFKEPSDGDQTLGAAISRHGRVVLPVYIDDERNIIEPLAFFHPAGMGHVHMNQDVDGVTRSLFNKIDAARKIIPSFPSAVFQVSRTGVAGFREGKAESPEMMPAVGVFRQSDLMKIDYYGPPGTFRCVSFADVLEGKYDDGFFKDKIVIVGVTAKGIEGELIMPFGEKAKRMTGAEVHANIVKNLIDGRRFRDVAPLVRYALTALFAFFLLDLFLAFEEKRTFLLWLCSIAFIVAAQIVLFVGWSLWFPPLHAYFSVTLVFVAAYLVRLGDAVRELDKAYGAVFCRLRHRNEETGEQFQKRGLIKFASLKGINSKIAMLEKVTAHMVLEKTLTDVALLSNISGVVVFGIDGKALIVNERAKSIFSALNLEMPAVEELFHALGPNIIGGHLPENTWEGPGDKGSFEPLTVTLNNPARIFMKMDLAPVRYQGSEYLVVVFTDITSIKEEEIRKAEMVSVVSHELNQPLTAVIGYSYLIAMQSEGQAHEYAMTINQEGERMSRFINAFLRVSRLESGRYEPVIEVVDVGEVVGSAVNAMTPLATENEIPLFYDNSLPGEIARADKDLIKQCVENLLENAIKYSPAGRPVAVAVVRGEKQISIRIKDNGYGISREDITSIFEKFSRGTSKAIKESRGSGLGLAFVKEAVEVMGGTILVESEEDKGSTFTITLPGEE